MLRKKYKIVLNVIEGVRNYNIVFKRTVPGDFRCNDKKCIYYKYCAHWIFTNHKLHTSDICISYPRISKTIKTRHYYSPYVIKETQNSW